MVFQHYNLFPHLTVEENVMLSPRIVKKVAAEKAHETAIKVLQQVMLFDEVTSALDLELTQEVLKVMEELA